LVVQTTGPPARSSVRSKAADCISWDDARRRSRQRWPLSVQAARFVQRVRTRGHRLPPGAVAARGARNRV